MRDCIFPRRAAALVIIFALLIFVSAPVSVLPVNAQGTSAIDTYAITNARIVPVSGAVIERGTIVIRDGLINAVGANVAAPADARIIDGAGLTVYPGLIDAYTSLGIPSASPTPATSARGGATALRVASSDPAAASAPNSTQPPGLQPEIVAADILRPGGSAIEAARNAGLTAALTIPREGIFIGQSAFINLSGETPQQTIVRSPVAMHIGFTPLRTGGYPQSLMGVFSALRQILLDTDRYLRANAIYERNPRGLRRPDQDKSLEALIPVITRQTPVVLYANTEREIRRALDLAREFDLRPIIAGGAEAWKVTDQLREQRVPVLLSLNFPKRTTMQVPEADPDPLRVLRERVDAPKTAGRLASAGIRFAFQSGQMTNIADFLPNAVKAVENGLARDEALRALTIRPAEIFGVADRLGSIEAGKIANLTVMRGDLFNKGTSIAQVFIDGRPVDLKPSTPSGAAGANGIANGTWALNVDLGAGAAAVTLLLQQEGENLRGSIQGALGSAPISGASVSASGDIRFTAPVTVGGQTTEAAFAGTITGNEMRGTVQIVGRGGGTFTGTRPNSSGGATPSASPSASPSPSPPPPGDTPPRSTGVGEAASTQASSFVNLVGTWTLSIAVGERDVPGTLTLRQEGANLSGTIQSPFGTSELKNGSMGADVFRFTTRATVEGRTLEISVSGGVNGNRMSGTVSADELGATSFTGTRTPQSRSSNKS
ncbi:MAG: amidohydrolase family protein [Pyrinomonadaceae bacterium]